MKQMHADLVKLGYAGSYARVAAFARAWREDRHRVELTRIIHQPNPISPGREGLAVLTGMT